MECGIRSLPFWRDDGRLKSEPIVDEAELKQGDDEAGD